MITFTEVNEINKILRNELIEQSGLQGKFIRNALSMHGTDLEELIDSSESEPLNKCKVIMLFELSNRSNTSDVSMTEKDDMITYYKSYAMNIIIYGDDSSDIANKIIARFRSEKVRNDLYDKGIYIESITNAVSMNEFHNETMWLRNDFSINISIKLNIPQISQEGEFMTFDKPSIIILE